MERNITNGSSQTLGKGLKNLKPPRRRPSQTQWKEDGRFDSSKVVPRERNNTKGSSRIIQRRPGSSRPLRRRQS
jgi:hypothetical protein